MKAEFIRESVFSVPRERLFGFHEREDAFSLLTPAWENIEVLNTATTLRPSEEVVRFVAKFLFLRFRFGMQHTVYEPPELFVGEQREGPFSFWRHQHRFIEAGWDQQPATMLQDRIEYGHPLLFGFRPFVSHRLRRLFRYRHRITADQLRVPIRDQRGVVITGATGLIGKRITEILLARGVPVIALVRDPALARRLLDPEVRCVYFDFENPGNDEWKQHIDGALGILHLAGRPLFKQHWTARCKRQIQSREGRIESTHHLIEAALASERRPEVFIWASAVYGLDFDIVAAENPHGDDLLERIYLAASELLEKVGTRTVQVRVGIVLSPTSGALKEMLPVFKSGLGGVMGNPDSWINWIHLEDVARIFVTALANPEMRGPYNAVSPAPVRMAEFTKTLARELWRRCQMVYPVPVLKMLFGEAGEDAAGGAPVRADRIMDCGYRFFYPELGQALASTLRQEPDRVEPGQRFGGQDVDDHMAGYSTGSLSESAGTASAQATTSAVLPGMT